MSNPEKLFSACFFLVVYMATNFVCPAQSAVNLPVWHLESWWEYTTVTDMHVQEAGSQEYADIVTTDVATRYTLSQIGSKTLTRGAMLTYEAYVLPFTGILDAAGIYHIVDPIPLDIDIEIRDASLTGELWVDTQTLGTIYFHRFIEGPLWADIPFQGWQEVGWIEIDMSEEYEPARDILAFPLEVGDAWTQDITFYTYGSYTLDYDIGSGPEHVEDTFDESEIYQFDITVPNQEMSHGYMTYRVEGDETSSDGAILANYAEDVKNLVYEEMTDLASSGSSVRINSMVKDLTGFFLIPDPTGTPEPTYTPVPPTPTSPPGEPTYTPIPFTPTPPVTSPTPTPTPPMESGITIATNLTEYHTGDPFLCTTTIVNTGPAINVDEYIVLDVYGSYWFWPDWGSEPGFQNRDLTEDSVYPDEVILEFVWPDVTGSVSGIKFWAALLDAASGDLFGGYGVTEWGYSE